MKAAAEFATPTFPAVLRWDVFGCNKLSKGVVVVTSEDGNPLTHVAVKKRGDYPPNHPKGGRNVDDDDFVHALWIILAERRLFVEVRTYVATNVPEPKILE
jgi:hypothetical protein